MPAGIERTAMEPTSDELAGIVDGFGGLTRPELRGAIEDLAARTGETVDPDALESAVEDAIAEYYLVAVNPEVAFTDPPAGEAEPVLIPGPAALPQLPEGGDDLPHLVDIVPRAIDREAAAESIADQLRSDADAATAAEDVDRAANLLDACYEVEAWGPVELDETKAELAALIEG